MSWFGEKERDGLGVRTRVVRSRRERMWDTSEWVERVGERR